MSTNETVADQLRRAYNLVDEAISIIDDIRGTLGPVWWPEAANRRLRLARSDLHHRLS